MLDVKGVAKYYGEVDALSDVTFSIDRGEVVGLLGPNGAGKTTLIRILTGFFEPSAGRVEVDGVDVVDDPLGVQAKVGYLPEATPLYPDMLVQEYLTMMADFRRIPQGRRRALISEAVWATDIADQLVRPISALSKGYRQRVGLAQAILHQPDLLILDEPTSGLDPTQVEQVRALITRLSARTTVLFSTHILSEVEQVCDRVLILLDGCLRADARLDELQSTPRVVVAVADQGVERRSVTARLGSLNGCIGVHPAPPRPGYHTVEVEGSADTDIARDVFRLARDAGWELGELRPVVRDLDSVFRELVRDHAATHEEAA